MDDVSAAKRLIAALDLTSLNPSDDEESILSLCQRASTPYGQTAAVCIFPQFIPFAKQHLPSGIKVATVINFPLGLADLHLLEKEISSALKLGADELDVVFPYRTFLSGDQEFCISYLELARRLSHPKTLKIIIEASSKRLATFVKLPTFALPPKPTLSKPQPAKPKFPQPLRLPT